MGSNVHLRLLPTNVTTTGGRLWIYEININGSRNIVKFYEIPFIIGLYRLYGDSINLGSGLILVRIYYNVHSNEWNILWIILRKNVMFKILFNMLTKMLWESFKLSLEILEISKFPKPIKHVLLGGANCYM